MNISFDKLNWSGRYLDYNGIRYFDYSASGFCFVMKGRKAEAVIVSDPINTVIDSLAQGVINSTLTVMIGIQTKKYLLKEYKLQDILDDVIISEDELENEAVEMSNTLKQDIKEQSKKEKKDLQTA